MVVYNPGAASATSMKTTKKLQNRPWKVAQILANTIDIKCKPSIMMAVEICYFRKLKSL